MEERCLRGYTRDSAHHHAFNERSTSFFIAVPFIVCFSLFGILNLVGGTALTIMSCKPKLTPKALASLQRLTRVPNLKIETNIDPMRVVGIMLLITGSLLVVIGLALGITACRSITNEHKRRRNLMTSSSGLTPLYSLVERRRASSSASSPSFISGRGRSNGKKCLEKTVSPILEASGEYESLECEKLAVEVHHVSSSSVRDISPSESICQLSSMAEETIFQTSLMEEPVCQPTLSVPQIRFGSHRLYACEILESGEMTEIDAQTKNEVTTLNETGSLG